MEDLIAKISESQDTLQTSLNSRLRELEEETSAQWDLIDDMSSHREGINQECSIPETTPSTSAPSSNQSTVPIRNTDGWWDTAECPSNAVEKVDEDERPAEWTSFWAAIKNSSRAQASALNIHACHHFNLYTASEGLQSGAAWGSYTF